MLNAEMLVINRQLNRTPDRDKERAVLDVDDFELSHF